ncbi:signal peptidase II [Ruminococcus gauvreauii]|uniref:Lipoprotein signal peptidase n=1 Tax=Ruminococcus gauvreauii TaxID=438033 RepID=A0ABY5VFU0_9FIRM|nr:signal peptidase II [Ruminococcus gauvreauii]UWP59425.1 signal peptidase II [Ruminococcus gauvreauii]
MTEKKHGVIYWIAGLVSVCILIGLDQWTKYLAVTHLSGQEDIVLIPNILQLHYLENRGAAFGVLQNQQWIFIILCLLFLVFAGYAYTVIPKTRHYFPLNFITVVLVAGAFGNLIDRIRLKYVVDFVYISAIDFPVFNVADIYVTVSAVLLFVYLIFFYREEDFTFLALKKKKGQ